MIVGAWLGVAWVAGVAWLTWEAWVAFVTRLANWGVNGKLLCCARSRIALASSGVSVIVGAWLGVAWVAGVAWLTKPFNCSRALAWAVVLGWTCCSICINWATWGFWGLKLFPCPASFIAFASVCVINKFCCGLMFWPFRPRAPGKFNPATVLPESTAFTPTPPVSNGFTTIGWLTTGLMRPWAANWAASNCIGSVIFAESLSCFVNPGKFCIPRVPKPFFRPLNLSEFVLASMRASIFWFKDAKKVSKPTGMAELPARLPGWAMASLMGLIAACICIWLTVGMLSPNGTLPTMHLSCQI